jgi:TetR/AcrR family tetracycline transcriptional repressor
MHPCERIVEAALDVLDADGIEAVTLRAVASRLEVQAPALYWHVKNKQQLLDEMGTEIQRRVQRALESIAPDASWQQGLAAYAAILRREYLAHRDGARTFSGTRLTDPEILRAQEPWLERWVAGGLDLVAAMDAAEVVTSYVVGFVIEEQERAQSQASDPDRYSVAARDAALGGDAPLVAEAGHDRGDTETRFARQLDLVLSGLAARLAS